MTVPTRPKICHIVHVDRLESIVKDGCLWCDAEVVQRAPVGEMIGMSHIKERRLQSMLTSRPGLHVGACVPFYFCPRSIMLYIIHQANHVDLAYKGGQGPIVHLQADLRRCIDWAEAQRRRWAFSLSNAGSRYFEDRSTVEQLEEIDWVAVEARQWQDCKDGKQAEFLLESNFPWHLVEMIGVHSRPIYQQAANVLARTDLRPELRIVPEWYY